MHIKYNIPDEVMREVSEQVRNMFGANNVVKTSVQQQWNIVYNCDEHGQPMWGGGHGGEE